MLRTRVEDKLGNTTRFVVMSRRARSPTPATAMHDQHRVPGSQRARRALQGLGGFATNGVNITKLESYIVDASFTVAQFYAEIEGHPSNVACRTPSTSCSTSRRR